jgi:hypothetical protein
MFKYIAALIQSLAQKGKPGLAARLATQQEYRNFRFWLAQRPLKLAPGPNDIILKDLERDGICIIQGFWSAEDCAAARAEIDRVITEYPKYVNKNAKADKRIYGANNASALIDKFAKDEKLLSIASAYSRTDTTTAFTLAARMPASADNHGSGEGWHRDAFLRQFKAILYLSDVAQENGPFQFIQDSHRESWILKDMKNGGLKYMQYRIEEEKITHILANKPGRLKTCTGLAGTLMLIDTSAIHRGKPIQAGTRYALTNYYFPTDAIDQSMYEKFDVLPRP